MAFNTKIQRKRAFSGASNSYKKVIPFVIVFAVLGSVWLFRSFAAPFSMYLTPSNSTVLAGNNFTVSLRIEPGTSVDGVTATIGYDPAILQYVSLDTQNSAFPTQLQGDGSNGKVTIARGILSPNVITTDSFIANVTFKALKATNSTDLKLAGNATYSGNYTNPSTVGATVTVNSNSATPPTPSADGTSPVVTISTPSENSRVTGKTTIAATSTDNLRVARMEIYVDNTVVASANTNKISTAFDFKGRKLAFGTHTIEVKAYDTSGNTGTSIVHVTKVK